MVAQWWHYMRLRIRKASHTYTVSVDSGVPLSLKRAKVLLNLRFTGLYNLLYLDSICSKALDISDATAGDAWYPWTVLDLYMYLGVMTTKQMKRTFLILYYGVCFSSFDNLQTAAAIFTKLVAVQSCTKQINESAIPSKRQFFPSKRHNNLFRFPLFCLFIQL